MDLLADLKTSGLCSLTSRSHDLKHLLSAERAARGSFYATRVGFVAINAKGQRIARSHNGFPASLSETRERWSKTEKDFYHLHAEGAGIFHAASMGYTTLGASAYVTHPPCPGCMQLLCAAGFARVVFSEQALLERHDWKADMVKSFELARAHNITIHIYRDTERSLKNADITRTELDLKKVYDQLLPDARWSSHDKSAISPATKPESPLWIWHPVIQTLVHAAKHGIACKGKGIIMDYLPECRAATAMIQAGIGRIFVRHKLPDTTDKSWGIEKEIEVAAAILKESSDLKIEPLDCLLDSASNCGLTYLDATREGITHAGIDILRIKT